MVRRQRPRKSFFFSLVRKKGENEIVQIARQVRGCYSKGFTTPRRLFDLNRREGFNYPTVTDDYTFSVLIVRRNVFISKHA